MHRYMNAVQEFMEARSCFLLTGPEEESMAIRCALHWCYEGLAKTDTSDIEGEHLQSLQRIKLFIESVGVPNYGHSELIEAEIDKISRTKKQKLCEDIDSLGLFFQLN